ncbi:MAG: AAA family ATPase [Roseovarius sp.]|jgi:hypothetical protein|nr:AAA family ATPase [Roseovarius sp.]
MADFTNDRLAVVDRKVDVPDLKTLEERFVKFRTRIRRALYGDTRKSMLDHVMMRETKEYADDAHKRRLREAGLTSVKSESRPAIMALARDGARLSGPSAEDDVYRLAAALHAESPWMRDVSAWMMHQMLRHVAAGGRGFALPPVILGGPPGIGKSHYARTLAKLVGVPVRMIDVGGGTAGFRIVGTEKGWGTEQPGVPVETILATKIANPVMVVDEIDKAGTAFSMRGTSSSLTTSLLQMLEPGTARHFECPYHRIRFDMSRVVWVMTANDVDRIPPPLRDRSRLFVLSKLTATDAVAHFDRFTSGLDDGHDLDRCRAFISRMCALPEGISLRQIQQLADTVNAPTVRMAH